MRFPILFLLFLALPLLEITAFVVVGSRIGVLATIGIVILTAFAGAILMRVQGFGLLQRIRAETEAGRLPQRELVHGLMVLVAGFLLLVPGFVTDTIGLLLFIPAFRDLVWSLIGVRLVTNVEFTRASRATGPHRGGGGTIDLDEDEFKRTDPGDSPWKRDDPDRLR